MRASTHVSGTIDLPRRMPLRQAPGTIRIPSVLQSWPGALGSAITLLFFVVAVLAHEIAPYSPLALDFPALHSPSRTHLMGTDNLGRDIHSAVVHGIRTSAAVVFWVTLLSGTIGLFVGAIAGYRGGAIDDLLMRITELFQAVPRFFLALLTLALLGRGLRTLILLLGITSWTLLARVVRADVLTMRERPYAESARALGASGGRVLLRHIVPNILPAAVVVLALGASRVVLLEASLSFLGLGDPNHISLGFLISNAQRFLGQAWWMSIFPGLAIVVSVFGINLLADATDEALNPLGVSRRQIYRVSPEPDSVR